MGPAVVAGMYQGTGQIRLAVFYLIGIMALALTILLRIDFERAKQDCNSLKMAMRIKSIKQKRKEMGTGRKGIFSFLSINSIVKGVKSTFSSSSGASSFLKS